MTRLGMASAAFLSLGLVPAEAPAQSPVKIGSLVCSVTEEDKTLVKTHLVLACDFTGLDEQLLGRYQGTVDRVGLNLGNIRGGELTWIVATLGTPENVDLDGTYVGAEAGVSVGQGLGANYLTGGFNRKFSLQPYSVEGKSGFGLALGGQSLVLESVD
jgi:hypothetical protein